MSERELNPAEPIPVCTLFSDGSVPEGNDTLQDAKKKANSQESLEPLTISQKEENEPTLCNVFAQSPSSAGAGDIFSEISKGHPAEDASNDSGSGEIYSDTVEISDAQQNVAAETLHVSRSVDSFIVEDLAESEISETPQPEHSETLQPDTAQQLKETPSTSVPPVIPRLAEENKLLKDPVIASPSFVSVTSFLINPDETMPSDISGQTAWDESSLSNLASDLGGLTIENVKSNLPDNKKDGEETPSTEPMPAEADQNETPSSEATIETKDQYVADMPSSPRSNLSSPQLAGTESLFSSALEGQQTGLFPGDKASEVDEDDPFAAALSNSALDRRRDAWLPTELTADVLKSCMMNHEAPDIDIERRTRPGLSSSELLEDPVKQLISKLTGSENIIRRENLTMEDVSPDKIGVQKLMETGNHRSAANLCAKLLTSHGQGFGQATQLSTNTPETLWLWYARIYILTKLKLFEMAATELAHFKNLDNPDLYYEFYPGTYPGRRGSMVPFEFRLLHAEFPRYVEKPQECLRRLHFIMATCEKIIYGFVNGKTESGDASGLVEHDVDASIQFWTKRKVDVMYCLGNTLIQLKDYVLAVKIYERILQYSPEDTVDLQSGIGRLFLHIGDIRAAQQHFMMAEKEAENDQKHNVQLLLNRGFMYIGTNNWREAYTQFQAVLDLEPHNITAVNNKAVCLLYLGKLKDAVSVLEAGAAQQSTREVQSKIQNINRHQALIQGLIANLSTLYELESSQFVVRKRGMFLKHIAQHCGDSFETACFKDI